MAANESTVTTMAPPLPKGRKLGDDHRRHLEGSGLTEAHMKLAELYSEDSSKKLGEIVRWSNWKLGPALVFPFFVPGQAEPVMYRIRPDRPRLQSKQGAKKPVKYEQPKGQAVIPYLPPNTRRGGWLRDAARPLLWTEGEKKALLLDQLGFATIGGTGVYCFHDAAKRDADDVWALHRVLLEHATIAGREHRIVFDADAADNEDVMLAARRLAGMLEAAGAARVLFVRIPQGGPKGIDDYFIAHGEDATRALLEQGQPIAGLPPEEPYAPLSSVRYLKGAELDPKLRLPHGYSIDRRGAVWRLAEKEGAEDKLVADGALLIRRIVLDLYSGEERAEIIFRRNKAWRSVLVDRRAMCDSRAIIAALAPFGASIESGTSAEVVRWLAKLEHVNERRLPRTTCVTRCGWHVLNDAPVFVAPGLIARDGGDLVFDDRAGRATVAGLGAKGDADAHLEALRGIFGEDVLAATAICAALAAPILKKLDAPNFAFHLAGDSSRGKSTMLRAAASLYGDPFDHAWVASWNSTQVGLETRAHILSDLPFCVDEAGVADERMRVAAAYMLVNGTGRARGKRDGGLRDMMGWRTVVVSTGERKLVGDQANTGAQARVIQAWVDGIGSWGAGEVETFNGTVAEHHGHLGAKWLEAVAEFDDDTWSELRRTMKDLARKIASGTSGPRQRQAGYIATLMIAESLAHKVLGLGDHEGATMLVWATEEFADHTQEVDSAAERAAREVGDWVSSVRHSHLARLSERTPNKAKLDPRMPLSGYWRPSSEDPTAQPPCLWVLPPALERVLKEGGHDTTVVVREWISRGWATGVDGAKKRQRVERRVNGGKVAVYELNPEVFGGVVEGAVGTVDTDQESFRDE